MVYIFGNKELNVCKIGYSARPNYRKKQLENGVFFHFDFEELIKGDLSKEKDVHHACRDFLIKNEWFVMSGALKVLSIPMFNKTKILGVDVLVDSDGYIERNSILKEHQRLSGYSFNYSQWLSLESTKDFIEDINKSSSKKAISTHSKNYLHPYLFLEMCRNLHPKIRMSAFEVALENKLVNNLEPSLVFSNPDQAVRIGVKEIIETV